MCSHRTPASLEPHRYLRYRDRCSTALSSRARLVSVRGRSARLQAAEGTEGRPAKKADELLGVVAAWKKNGSVIFASTDCGSEKYVAVWAVDSTLGERRERPPRDDCGPVSVHGVSLQLSYRECNSLSN